MSSTKPIDPTKFDVAKDAIKLEIHPLAEKLPPMNKEDFEHLKESIKDQGLLVPIVLCDHNGTLKVLEGRNRFNACKEAKVYRFKPEDFVEYTGNSPFEFVLSSNLDRRQLNDSQRAILAAENVDADFGYNQYRKDKGVVTQDAAAKMFKVSVASIKIAKEVLRDATPEDVQRIRKGDVRVSAIKKKLDEAKEKAEAEAKAASAPGGEPAVTPAAPLDPNERIKRKIHDCNTGRSKTVTKTRAEWDEDDRKLEEEARVVQVESFKDRWNKLDEQQKRAFVLAFRDEVAAHLKYIGQQMSMAA
jgi:ParB-like chromosome segregation protein Spo0J